MMHCPFQQTRSRTRLRRWCVVISFLIVPLRSTPQPNAHALVIVIHDGAGAPLAGVSIQLRSRADGSLLAHAVTDASGRATFNDVATTPIRVIVRGTLAHGTPLIQPGQDADGIALFPASSFTTLDLIAASNGIVAPDPRAMAEHPTVALLTPTPRVHAPSVHHVWLFLGIVSALGAALLLIITSVRRGRQ